MQRTTKYKAKSTEGLSRIAGYHPGIIRERLFRRIWLILGAVFASGLLSGACFSGDASAASCEDGSISCIVVQFGKLTGDRTVNPSSNIDSATQFQLPVSINIRHDPGYKVDYTVRVYGSGSSLMNGSELIPSIGTDTSYNDLGKNGSEWGMRWSLGENDLYSNYHPVPGSSETAVVVHDGVMERDTTDLTEKLTLGFAVAVDGNQASGSYSNTVTVAIVASPKDLRNSIFDISNMQDMTPEICAGTTTPSKTATTLFDTDGSHAGDNSYVPETTLTDVRDGKTYLVRKLADGNCWMSQNLSLNLVAGQELTNRTTDLNSKRSWVPANTTQTELSLDDPWINNDGIERSLSYDWNQYWTDKSYDNAFTADGNSAYGGKVGYAQRGNYYNWFAATAGSGESADVKTTTEAGVIAGTYRIKDGTVQDSVCPRGWKLPTGGATAVGQTNGETKSFYNLVQIYTGNVGSFTGDSDSLYVSPMNFVPAGYVNSDSTRIGSIGVSQFYYSDTASSINRAGTLYYGNTAVIPGPGDGVKGHGMSVRCVAR